MNEPNECIEQARTDELVCSLRATKQVRVATFSADGRFLAFGGFDERVTIITHLPVRGRDGEVERLSLHELTARLSGAARGGDASEPPAMTPVAPSLVVG